MEPTVTLARRFWAAIEPIHSIVYFAPEPLEAARKTGLRGFWMSYFASRVAPLGPLPAPAVEAMTYGFAPGMVSRAIPDAWHFASPEAVLDARLASAPEALRLHVAAALLDGAAGELADLLWEGVAGCRYDGRPLAAAWAGVPRPADPVGALWLAATVTPISPYGPSMVLLWSTYQNSTMSSSSSRQSGSTRRSCFSSAR